MAINLLQSWWLNDNVVESPRLGVRYGRIPVELLIGLMAPCLIGSHSRATDRFPGRACVYGNTRRKQTLSAHSAEPSEKRKEKEIRGGEGGREEGGKEGYFWTSLSAHASPPRYFIPLRRHSRRRARERRLRKALRAMSQFQFQFQRRVNNNNNNKGLQTFLRGFIPLRTRGHDVGGGVRFDLSLAPHLGGGPG